MASLAIRGAPIQMPAQEAEQPNLKEKLKETTIKVLKVVSSILLTVGAYAALAGTMVGLFLATQNISFAIEHADKFITTMISAVGQNALNSMANPFRLYTTIYQALYCRNAPVAPRSREGSIDSLDGDVELASVASSHSSHSSRSSRSSHSE